MCVMSEVSVFVNNDIYRLGDAVIWDSYSLRLLTCNSYETTFLHKYLVNKNVRNIASLGIQNNTLSQNEELILSQRLKIASITLSEMVQTGKWEMPKSDQLVVHLRLGDIIAFKDGSKDHSRMKHHYINYDKTIESIRGSVKEKVVIVTAIHYQSLENDGISPNNGIEIESCKLSENCVPSYNESLLLLEKLKDEITEMGKSVEVRSSKDIDADFVYLCFSNELVLSGVSGFGMAAYYQNTFIMGLEKSMVNLNCGQDWAVLAPKILWSLRSAYVNNINN
jgi:hypothetical protein